LCRCETSFLRKIKILLGLSISDSQANFLMSKIVFSLIKRWSRGEICWVLHPSRQQYMENTLNFRGNSLFFSQREIIHSFSGKFSHFRGSSLFLQGNFSQKFSEILFFPALFHSKFQFLLLKFGAPSKTTLAPHTIDDGGTAENVCKATSSVD